MALNIRQQKFVEFYILYNGNGTKAAEMAGYSAKTAGAKAFELLKIVEISDAIAKRRAKLQSRFEVTTERVTAELARIAFSRMTKHAKYGPDGVDIIDSDTVDDDDVAAVSEVSQMSTEFGHNVKVRLHDKVKALELLSKKLGLFDGASRKNQGSEGSKDVLEDVEAVFNEESEDPTDQGSGPV